MDRIMRTNINIDDTLMKAAMERSGLPTKKAAVEEGLKLLVRMANQLDLLKLAGKVHWEGDLDEMRQGREFDWDGTIAGDAEADDDKSGNKD